MDFDKAAGAGALGLILLIPAGLVCGGLYLGLNAMDWPPVLALVGLANLYPKQGTALGLAAMLSRPLAVVGALVALFA